MPKQKPVVSIIIPNYNHAQYISDAINSVLNQTYPDYEVIVVDDGSKDNSREVIDAYGGKIRAIYQQNQGLSAARNTGITAAQGDYIGVLDADDMYEPEFISTLVSLLESQPDADGVYCGYRFVDHLNNPLPQVEAREVAPEKLYGALVDGNFLVPESIFVRKYCYEKVGLFDTSLRALEDLDMWLRITSQFRVTHTTKILTRHRILPGSMSTDPTRQFQNRLKVIEKHFGAEPISSEAWSEAQRRAYGRAYLVSAVEYLQAHNEDRAFECICSMVAISPNLVANVETFYELVCGDQPKGYRGEFSSVDLEKSSQTVFRLLVRLSQVPELHEFMHLKQIAYANAYYASGLIAYGQGKTNAARNFFLMAVKYRPQLLLDRTLTGFLLRSLIGTKLIRSMKKFLGRSN
ncbi:MAG: glycosyltransferase [Anaerolineales bacterium]|nr:glycosyltransferase [Anaerolineales bacterium]